MSSFQISGNIVDVCRQTIFPGTITVEKGFIKAIALESDKHYQEYILPGFVDACVHLESSMLVPTEFARLATVHGTVAAVCETHKIANVLGRSGVQFLVDNATQTPFTFAFAAPSCVPATAYEIAESKLTPSNIHFWFEQQNVSSGSKAIAVPGVLTQKPEANQKILARNIGLPIDSRAPRLQGKETLLCKSVGINTDFECLTLAEAEEKLKAGIKILIREGSAAKNFAALHPLIESHPDRCMFCSDHKYPDDLVTGHINNLVKRSLCLGKGATSASNAEACVARHDLMKILQVACVNPVYHYNLDIGLLRPNDPADFIVVDNLQDFTVQRTYCHGVLVAKSGQSLLPSVEIEPVNPFVTAPKRVSDFYLPAFDSTVKVIEAVDGQLTTAERHLPPLIKNDEIASDVQRDLLKIAVVNRDRNTKPAVALVKNFGLKRGAIAKLAEGIASSIAHDSHHIVAVGTTDIEICAAVDKIIFNGGGISVARGNSVQILPLPVAGLMSTDDGYRVARKYAELNTRAKLLGSTLTAPFMTLSQIA